MHHNKTVDLLKIRAARVEMAEEAEEARSWLIEQGIDVEGVTQHVDLAVGGGVAGHGFLGNLVEADPPDHAVGAREELVDEALDLTCASPRGLEDPTEATHQWTTQHMIGEQPSNSGSVQQTEPHVAVDLFGDHREGIAGFNGVGFDLA